MKGKIFVLQLKLGKMTGRELAEWFHISYNTYKKSSESKQRYLFKLKDYCLYEQVRGGVIIKEIYISEYNKNLKAEQTKKFLFSLNKHNNIISLTGLEEEDDISYYHSRQIRDKLFGKEPTNINVGARGIIGTREVIWAVKLGTNEYRKMTKEEDELFNVLINQEYIGKLTPEAVRAQQLILNYCSKEGMSVKEYQELLTEQNFNFFNDVIVKFRDITGYQIANPNEYTIGQEWTWDESESEEYRAFLAKELKNLKEN